MMESGFLTIIKGIKNKEREKNSLCSTGLWLEGSI
jgi:hypothetical protein